MKFKRNLSFANSDVFGLDISSSQIRMVQLKKTRDNFVVTAAGMNQISVTDSDDKDLQRTATIETIRQSLLLSRIKSPLAVCGLCGPELAVRHFKFPLLSEDEIDSAVKLEAEQVCPFDISESAIDYQLMPNGPENIRGVFVAATNNLVENKTRLTEDSDLQTVLMDANGLALLNCFAQFDKKFPGQTVTILNVDNDFVNLAIVTGNSFPFVRDTNYAGSAIIKQIAANKNITAQQVTEELFPEENNTELNTQKTDNCLSDAAHQLITDVNEGLKYYTVQEDLAVIEKIFVCGKFASAKGFVQLLDSRLQPQVVLWNPFEDLDSDLPDNCCQLLKQKGHEMAVAAGLAMRSI